MCIALTRQSPSLMSLSVTIFATSDVILINARLVDVLNVRYSVLVFIPAACRNYRLQQAQRPYRCCCFFFCPAVKEQDRKDDRNYDIVDRWTDHFCYYPDAGDNIDHFANVIVLLNRVVGTWY